MSKTPKIVEFKPAQASSEMPDLSPPRRTLRDLQDRQSVHRRRSAELEVAIGRLGTASRAVIEAKAAIDAFDADSIASTATWAKAALRSGDAPEIDIERRQKLAADLFIAAQKATAETAAKDLLLREKNDADRAAAALDGEIEIAIADVLAEKVKIMMGDLQRRALMAAVAQRHLLNAVDLIFTIGGRDRSDERRWPGILAMAGRLLDDMRSATAAPPTPDMGTRSVAIWASLLDRLKADATAGTDTAEFDLAAAIQP